MPRWGKTSKKVATSIWKTSRPTVVCHLLKWRKYVSMSLDHEGFWLGGSRAPRVRLPMIFLSPTVADNIVITWTAGQGRKLSTASNYEQWLTRGCSNISPFSPDFKWRKMLVCYRWEFIMHVRWLLELCDKINLPPTLSTVGVVRVSNVSPHPSQMTNGENCNLTSFFVFDAAILRSMTYVHRGNHTKATWSASRVRKQYYEFCQSDFWK